MPNCTIVVLDEVNIKITNLDLDTRKYLVKKFKIVDPTARFRPAFKLRGWDGAVSFFAIGGTTYLNLMDQIIPELEQRNYDIEVEDLRTSPVPEFNKITSEFWGEKCWPKGHRFEGQPIRLRDDQVDVVNNFLANTQSLQEVATGAGKTIMTATLSKICEKYGRTITIVPNKSLVEQTEEDFINVGLDVGVYYGDRKDLDKTHTICTWQSLNILDKKSKDFDADSMEITLNEFLKNVNTIIVDEVHMAKADVLKNLLTRNLAGSFIRWGLTGTVPKEQLNFENIRVSIGDVVGRISAHDLQQKGILSQCSVNIIQTAEWKEFKGYAEELKYLVTNEERIDFIASKISKISEGGNTLILVDRIECGNMLKEKLSKLTGNEVSFISGAVKTKDRREEYAEVSISNEKIIVATYGVAAVGINIPRIFNLVLLEPGKSFVRVIQSIGRGIRKAEDKDHVEIWDITAATKYAKRHLTERKKYYNDAKYPFKIEKVRYQ